MPADDLDLPQMPAVAVHGPLSLDHSADEGGLGDLMLGTRLLDEYEIGRACIPGLVVMLAHTP